MWRAAGGASGGGGAAAPRLALLLGEDLVCEANGGLEALPQHSAALTVHRLDAEAVLVARKQPVEASAPRPTHAAAAAAAMEPSALPVFVELGAGRGGLSFAIGAVELANVAVVLPNPFPLH